MFRLLSVMLFSILLFTSCKNQLDLVSAQPVSIPEAPLIAPSALTADLQEYFAVLNQSNLSVSSFASGDELTYSVSPTLPAGLSLDTSTGIISGVPSASMEDSVYTITAQNDSGSVDYDISLTILDGYIVDDLSDAAGDANTGDGGICANASGDCTFRAAIDQAKFDTGRKMVLLDAQSYQIDADLDLGNAGADLLIVGSGPSNTSINSNNSASVNFTSSSGTATFRNLSIDNFGSNGSSPAQVIYLTGSAIVKFQDTIIQDNYSSAGAIIQANNSSRIEMTGVYIYNNQSFGRGILYAYSSAVAVIDRTTWYQNTGDYGGCFEGQNSSNTTIKNSTCFGNTTLTDQKAAINIGTCGCSTVATLTNNLIANNQHSGTPGEPAGLMFGRASSSSTTGTIANNIITNNLDSAMSESNCFARATGGTINDLGSNILTGADCSNGRFNNGSTLFNTDPMLTDTVPSDNGGKVPTISISTSSPAIDAGLNGSCDAFDQRGLPRFVDFNSTGANCDIGPLELQL